MANKKRKETRRINSKSEDKGKKRETRDKCEIMQEERNDNVDIRNAS